MTHLKIKNNKKGFTLAELLIVVAIIAVLTAIAIPVFSAQLEKARQGTDLANLRSAYAQAQVNALNSKDYIGYSDTAVTITSNGSWDKLEEHKVGDTEVPTDLVKGTAYYVKTVTDTSTNVTTVTFPTSKT